MENLRPNTLVNRTRCRSVPVTANVRRQMHHLVPPGPTLRLEFGVPLYIHWTVPALGASFAALPLMASRDGVGLLGFIFMSGFIVLLTLLHELGHALAAALFRTRVTGIVLSAYGGTCFIEAMPDRLVGKVLIACGGVIAQVAAFAGVAILIWTFGAPTSYWLVCGAVVFLGLNPLFMLFSIIPYRDNDAAQLIWMVRVGR